MDFQQEEKRLSFKKFLSSTWWSVKLYWKINPKLATTFIIFDSLVELMQIVNTYVFAKIIDILLSVSQGNTEFKWVYFAIAIFFATSVTMTILNMISNYSTRMLQTSSYSKYQELLYKKMELLGIETLERSEVNNLIARAQQSWRMIESQFQSVTSIVSIVTVLISTGIIIFIFSPYLIPLLIVVTLPYIYFDRKYQKTIWHEDKRLTEQRRAAYDSSGILQDSQMLQELVITGGRDILEKKFTNFVENWYRTISRLRASFYRKVVALRLIRSLVEAYAYYLVILRFLAKSMTIGNVTFYWRSISSFVGNVQSLSDFLSGMFESSLRIAEMRELFEMKPKFKDGEVKMPTLQTGPEIQLNDVSFSYPKTHREVIKHVNLTIKPGEKVAIVGHNGAGKTTLVKLICRFYQVSGGTLSINNTNINNLNINTWYKNIGVLFQEFNNYRHLTARENILIGDITKKISKARIRNAAKKADAHEFIKEFKKGYDQILSEKYKDGTRPSSGQWQKLAIARFFYRNAPLIIFDEPTAAIDAMSEKKIFDKIYKFFNGKTVIIISHRFSTVRNADRIIVFEKGKVIEHGNHDQLMALGGTYAKAFKTQAEGYK